MMKNLLTGMVLLLGLGLAACQSGPDEDPAANTAETMKQDSTMTEPANKFAGIEFASAKDTTCGMPLSAGVADTVMLEGKVYGFCSAECKNEFVTMLETQHKR